MFKTSQTLASCLFFATPAIAGNLHILAPEIEGLHQSDGQGLYDRVIQEIETDVSVEVQVLPPLRAFNTFESCTDCCITTANANPEFYDFQNGYVLSEPVTVAQVFIWTLPGTEPISDLASLKGLRVGARQGMPYGTSIESAGLNLDFSPSIESNIKKARAGRLDAFLGYTPDAYAAFDALGEPLFSHAKDAPIVTHPDSIVCKSSDQAETYIGQFNDQLAEMIASGQLEDMASE